MADPPSHLTQEVLRLFDAKAPAWPSKYTPRGRLMHRLTRLTAAVAYCVPTGSRVLDLGCGTGELARVIAAAGMHTTGCDISPVMLYHAASADPNGMIRWVQLDPDWRKLPFEDGSFHAVVLSSVLEYVEDPAAVLRECRRVLCADGTVLCTVPDPFHPVRWLELAARVVTRVPTVGAVGGRCHRLDPYLTYLRVSHQRHSGWWWNVAAMHSGLWPAVLKSPSGQRLPLRLLAFHRQDDYREVE
jgi:SAM-dependent methyltransferase